MMCDHKRIKCVNCEFFCADCGAKVEAPAGEKPADDKPTKKKGGKGK